MDAIAIDKYHIGLLCRAHPNIAPGNIVQIFKSITAREIFLGNHAKKELWREEFWTNGRRVSTVGEQGSWDTVEQYLQKQSEPRTDLRHLKLFEKPKKMAQWQLAPAKPQSGGAAQQV